MPPVFHRFYTLTGWLLDRIEKYPKNVRFTFGQQLTNKCLLVIEKIVSASYNRKRKENLQDANLELEVIRVFLRLSMDRKYISKKQYEFAINELLEIGKMIGGWIGASR